MQKAIDLLIKHRIEDGVAKDNPFIFARNNFNSLNSQWACDVVKRVARNAKLKQPNFIFSTKLQKHIATMSQLFNLKDNELDILASFLGHNIQVHRDFYRLLKNTIILAKISKILIAAEKGKMHKYQGKSLDEIDEVASKDELSEFSDSDESVLSSFSDELQESKKLSTTTSTKQLTENNTSNIAVRKDKNRTFEKIKGFEKKKKENNKKLFGWKKKSVLWKNIYRNFCYWKCYQEKKSVKIVWISLEVFLRKEAGNKLNILFTRELNKNFDTKETFIFN